MPINASHEYFTAEKAYLAAESTNEKITTLEALITAAPKHKGTEKLLAGLRLRLKKLKSQQQKNKKTGKGKKGIRKEGFQVALIGKANVGKSNLLNALTNAHANISTIPFSTNEPEIGIMEYDGVKAQIVDLPSIGKDFDFNIANNADLLLLVVTEPETATELNTILFKATGIKIIVINKIDNLTPIELRKLTERCKSQRLKNIVFVSALRREGIEILKQLIFNNMHVIRVYTKEPGKNPNILPTVLKENSTIIDVAETIYKGFSQKVKEARLTGPSGKFKNQRVGMKHVCKDKDVVEFKT